MPNIRATSKVWFLGNSDRYSGKLLAGLGDVSQPGYEFNLDLAKSIIIKA